MSSFKFSFVVILALFFYSCSKINSVSIENAPESVFKGDSLQLKAVVKGEGSPDTTLNWVILESVSKGTSISNRGLLVVDREEKSPSLTIKAIAINDTSKSNSVVLKTMVNQKYLLGNWSSVVDNKKINLILSNDSWVCKYFDGDSYSIGGLNWTFVNNDDIATKDEFPDGYIISGTVDKVRGSFNNVFQGKVNRFKLFLTKDYSKFLRVDMNADETKRGPDRIFTKEN